jgi:hypothetical protein
MAVLQKVICRVNAISIRIPKPFFTGIEEIILKFIWNHKRPQAPKQSQAKSNAGGITQYLNSNFTIES